MFSTLQPINIYGSMSSTCTIRNLHIHSSSQQHNHSERELRQPSHVGMSYAICKVFVHYHTAGIIYLVNSAGANIIRSPRSVAALVIGTPTVVYRSKFGNGYVDIFHCSREICTPLCICDPLSFAISGQGGRISCIQP